MKKLEIVFVVLTLAAFTISINGIVGGNILSLLLSVVLIFVCVGLGIKGMGRSQEGTNNQKALALASYTVGTSLLVLASLFRIMFWPGAYYLTYLATILVLIVFAVNVMACVRTKEKYYERLLFRNAFYLGWTLILVSLPSHALINYKYGKSPFYQEYIRASDAVKADPDNRDLWEQQNKAFRKLQNTRQYLDNVALEEERRNK